MVVIGVTGNIGSGKSTVCQILAKLGAAIVDADKLAQETYKPYGEAWQELVNAFGKDILSSGQEIDRQKLGQIVFSNPTALTRLNHIVHPKAYSMAKERIATYRRQGLRAVALEAALLIEANWTRLVDQVWLVVASEATVIHRLKEGKATNQSEVLARLKSQMPAEEKAKYADEVVYNDGDLNQLEARLTQLWNELDIDAKIND
ncbi:MAG: dephospho-CoA kinase [Chloroflexi bacterium]|jgi:dephospho-CoA kinase|nr:dephospho-CoA kinase [Chloroflexota bacterium]